MPIHKSLRDVGFKCDFPLASSARVTGMCGKQSFINSRGLHEHRKSIRMYNFSYSACKSRKINFWRTRTFSRRNWNTIRSNFTTALPLSPFPFPLSPDVSDKHSAPQRQITHRHCHFAQNLLRQRGFRPLQQLVQTRRHQFHTDPDFALWRMRKEKSMTFAVEPERKTSQILTSVTKQPTHCTICGQSWLLSTTSKSRMMRLFSSWFPDFLIIFIAKYAQKLITWFEKIDKKSTDMEFPTFTAKTSPVFLKRILTTVPHVPWLNVEKCTRTS